MGEILSTNSLPRIIVEENYRFSSLEYAIIPRVHSVEEGPSPVLYKG
jgi:hypothetical protein